MSTIRVEHRHGLTVEQARERLHALGDYLQNKHGVLVRWISDDKANFQGKYAMFSFNAEALLEGPVVAIVAPDPGMLLRSKARDYLDSKLKKYLDPATPVDALPRR